MKTWILIAIIALVPGASLIALMLYLYQRRAQRNTAGPAG